MLIINNVNCINFRRSNHDIRYFLIQYRILIKYIVIDNDILAVFYRTQTTINCACHIAQSLSHHQYIILTIMII